MRPSQSDRFLRCLACEQTIEKSRGKPVSPADAVINVQITRRGHIGLAVHPGHRTPLVPICGVYFPQSRRYDLHLWVPFHHLVNHTEEGAGIEIGRRGDLGTTDAESLLEVFFVTD